MEEKATAFDAMGAQAGTFETKRDSLIVHPGLGMHPYEKTRGDEKTRGAFTYRVEGDTLHMAFAISSPKDTAKMGTFAIVMRRIH